MFIHTCIHVGKLHNYGMRFMFYKNNYKTFPFLLSPFLDTSGSSRPRSESDVGLSSAAVPVKQVKMEKMAGGSPEEEAKKVDDTGNNTIVVVPEWAPHCRCDARLPV